MMEHQVMELALTTLPSARAPPWGSSQTPRLFDVPPADSPERSSHDASSVTPSRLPLRMLHDRILVQLDKDASERRSASGIVIPATASLGRRLAWAQVVAAGPSVRQVSVGDRVLFDPEDRSEVEVATKDYILLRERDLHAVAEPEARERELGLYL